MHKNAISVFCILFGLSVANAANAPDNSAKNKIQKNQEVTALDQSNSQADIELTSEIRKQVVAQESLSTNAKNVKIISNGGQVLLKGPVESLNEKHTIRSIAIKVAGAAQVNDQIEVIKK